MLNVISSPTFLTVAGIVWGLACKYWKPLAGIPNFLIPFVTALGTLLASLAAASPTMNPTSFQLTAFFGAGILGHLGAACWQAIQNALIYEVFLRHPIKAAGIEKVA